MSEYHFNLLMELLQATQESQGDPQVVYPLLARNTDKLDETTAEILHEYGTNALREVDADKVIYVAADIVTFSDLIQKFPLGNTANNIEIALTGCKIGLMVYTREALPQLWAITQNTLGVVYRKRIKGDKAENIESAICAFQAALQVYTRQDFPQAWAEVQNNLGNAYSQRINGDKASNIENAICAFQAALQLISREAFPQFWALVQNNLGNGYSQRIKGDEAENIENGICAFQAALQVTIREAFPQQWADTQHNLGLAYSQRIKGDEAENIENGICAFQAALQVTTREAFPQQWADTQHKLGLAYRNRIKGNQADNIEKAICAFQAALQVITRETFPQKWAEIQINLGLAYCDILKDKVDNFENSLRATIKTDMLKANKANNKNVEKNIENAICAFKAALQVYTLQDFPQDWAVVQMNLGFAYWYRINGDKADNIENAIIAYNCALEVRTREVSPEDWAMSQYHIALAYRGRIKGDKADNIEKAITAYEAALQVYNREASPRHWARMQMNLANAYFERIKGDKADNIEKAISLNQEALQVASREALPYDWARTQLNLGNAYRGRIKEDFADNIEKAISAFQAALQVITREAFPENWVSTQSNLGIAYWDRIRGDKADNIENAISAYQAALQVASREAFPENWANTQNNLGNAYKDRIRGDRAENIEKAICAYQDALQVYTREAFPQYHALTLSNLGQLYKDTGKFNSAYTSYKSAIATIDLLRNDIVSGEESKRKQAEEWIRIYNGVVGVCLELNNIKEAIEYVERSKTRNLVELILERDSKTIFPPEVATKLEEYRNEIATGQYQLQNARAENPRFLAQHLLQLRHKCNKLQNRELPVGADFKFDSFGEKLDRRTAIIEWYILDSKILAFIITQEKEVKVWQSQPEELEALANWTNQYLDNYGTQKHQWLNQLEEELKKLALILHIDEILNQIPNYCDKLILIPHRFLHLLPLHALPVGESYLLDLFSQGVTYAPSCQILEQVQQRQRPDFQSLFAIQNPTGDLKFTDQEVKSISSLFPSPRVLFKSNATKAALDRATSHLQQVDYLHFSCHGSFDLDSPFLLLADAKVDSIPTDADPKQYLEIDKGFIDLSKCLTLDNLFERGFDLKKCRLVVLSACETGLIDFNNTSDEYIGLPSGFLYAGSSSVVSSLWTVDDMSTAYLMIKFLQILKAAFDSSEDVSVAVALKRAQHWLRNITWKDLVKWENDLELDGSNNREIVAKSKPYGDIDEKPFESPYHWAGFTAIGK